jgi:hypothetical protein
MLVVMVVLTLLIGLSVAVMLGVMRTYEADATLYQNVVAQEQLADTFRDDVAAASAAPGRANAFTASSRCLILRRPGGGLVVYEPDDHGVRRTVRDDGAEESRVLPLGSRTATVAFLRGEPDDRLLTLRWVEKRGSEGAQVDHVQEFTAALGGARR